MTKTTECLLWRLFAFVVKKNAAVGGEVTYLSFPPRLNPICVFMWAAEVAFRHLIALPQHGHSLLERLNMPLPRHLFTICTYLQGLIFVYCPC